LSGKIRSGLAAQKLREAETKNASRLT